MKASDDLFQLIKSLTKNEKRYFRMFAALQKGNKTYLTLFNEISRQKVYDETLLKEKFSGEKFITQLSFTKNYLYKLISKSLISYYSESIPDQRISELIIRAKILFNKALFTQYFKTIDRARVLAEKYERFGYLIEILDMARIIVKKEEIRKNLNRKIYDDAETILGKSGNLFEYSSILNKVLRITRTLGKSRDLKGERELKTILKLPLMKNISMAKSERAKEMFYLIMELVHQSDSNELLLINYAEKRLKIINENPVPFEGHIINYKKDVLYKLLMTAAEKGNYKDIEIYFNEFQNTSGPENSSEEINNFSFYAELTLNKIIKSESGRTPDKLISYIETRLENYKNKIDIEIELTLKFAIIKLFAMQGKYESALPRINNLLNHPQLNIKSEFECYLRLINLIVHFELGNFDLLEYLLKSTYRYLYKRKKLYKLEILILNFIRRIPLMNTPDSVKMNFAILKKEMQKLKQDPYEKNAFEYFDFLRWVDSKADSK